MKTADRNSTTLVCLLHTETRVDAVLIKQPVGALSELENSARWLPEQQLCSQGRLGNPA